MSAFDVFPRRNLPDEAEEWGREVETRISNAELASSVSGKSISGLNRTTASSLDTLAYQVGEIKRLQDSIPVAQQRTAQATNFGLPSSGWNTIATTSFVVSGDGYLSVTAVASGQLVSSTGPGLKTCEYRLVAGSDASAVIDGLFASPSGTWVNNFMVTWAWGISPPANSAVNISLQARPADTSSWGAGSGSYAVLTCFGTTTRA